MHPTWIILQYIIQTGGIVVIALFFIPIIYTILFESGYTFQTQFVSDMADQLWTWSYVFFIAGMAGNTIWFIRALQAYQRTQRVY